MLQTVKPNFVVIILGFNNCNKKLLPYILHIIVIVIIIIIILD